MRCRPIELDSSHWGGARHAIAYNVEQNTSVDHAAPGRGWRIGRDTGPLGLARCQRAVARGSDRGAPGDWEILDFAVRRRPPRPAPSCSMNPSDSLLVSAGE